jgi:cytochrome c-type biogenesis protein CcmF
VGPPWFEIAFAIPMLPLVFLVGIGMHTVWRTQSASGLWKLLKGPAVITIIAGIAVPAFLYGRAGLLVTAGTIAALWIVATALIHPFRSWRRVPGTPGMTRGVFGMSVAHLGLGVFVLGVTIVSAFSVEADVRMTPGEKVEVAGYEFELRGLQNVQGPNFRALEGEIEVRKDGEFIATLRPQKRTYLVQQSPMTEAGIDTGWNRDIFVALGDPLGNDAWSVRLQYKPLIVFIWFGAFVMALGGVIAASDRRYRVNVTVRERRKAFAEYPA